MPAEIIKSSETPLENAMRHIKIKTLIRWGDEDRFNDVSSVSVFKKGIWNHQTVIFSGAGHVPLMEVPEKTRRSSTKIFWKGSSIGIVDSNANNFKITF